MPSESFCAVVAQGTSFLCVAALFSFQFASVPRLFCRFSPTRENGIHSRAQSPSSSHEVGDAARELTLTVYSFWCACGPTPSSPLPQYGTLISCVPERLNSYTKEKVLSHLIIMHNGSKDSIQQDVNKWLDGES